MLFFLSGEMSEGFPMTSELDTSLLLDKRSMFECSVCKTVSYTKREFKKHMQTAHESVTPPVCCTTCSFSCYSHKQLLQHCKLVHKYTCEPCGKSFSSFSGCQGHNKVHHGTGHNLWSCKTCGKKYVAASRLEIHERSHSDSRPFICVTCDKTYKHKKDLLGHTCPG